MKGNDIPLCSVCIANYNGENTLSSCLDSIINQNFDYPIEIVLHDDASTDGSVSLVKNKYPEIKIITNDVNVGFCVSNNRMVESAKGTFVLLLNNDAMLMPDALNTLYEASRLHGEGIFGLPQYNAKNSELIDYGSNMDFFLNPIPNLNDLRPDVGMIIGACLWIPKRVWDDLGGFPAWFESLAEDMYLCCCARLRGYPVKCINKSGFRHWVGAALGGGKVTVNRTLSTSIKRRSLSERNKTQTMILCYPTVLIVVIFPIHIVLLTIEGVLVSLLKKQKQIWIQVYWNSMKSIWENRKLLIEKRRQIQNERVVSHISFIRRFSFFPHKIELLKKYGIPNIED